MNKLFKYFVDRYIEIVEYAKSKGFLTEAEDSQQLFQGFLCLYIAGLVDIVAIVIGTIGYFFTGFLVFIGVVFLVVSIAFFILSVMNFTEAFGWWIPYRKLQNARRSEYNF